jgi:hypothetical protein
LVRFLLLSLSYIFDHVASLFASVLKAAIPSPDTVQAAQAGDAARY